MDWQLFLSIAHLIGFAFGLGGATLSDVLFFKSLRSRKFSSDSLNSLGTASQLIWTGLTILIASGIARFALVYFEQGSLPFLTVPRWQAKLTLVAIVAINGLVFKFLILPFLRSTADQPVSLTAWDSRIWQLALTGSISVSSWYGILIISSLAWGLNYLYFMGIYAAAVIAGFLVGNFLIRRALSDPQNAR